MRTLLLLAMATLVAGCNLTKVQVDSRARHDQVAWRDDFATARKDARLLSKPMLLVMVAGPKDDAC